MSTHFRIARAIPRYVASATTYTGEVLADSPLGYWRLGEASGATAADSSGNSHNMTYSGSISFGQASLLPSQSDTSISFQGSGGLSIGKASLADASWMHPTTFSIEAWVKWDGTRAVDTMCIASKTIGGTVNATNYQFMFYKPSGTTNLAIIAVNTSGTSVTLVDSSSFLNGSAVRHVVATWDGTTVKLYGDGSLLTSTSLSGSLASSISSPLTIADTGGGSRQWSGVLDEVAYYGTALSSTRIAAHYAAR